MTPADRKAAERQRRKDAGLVRFEVYVRPEHRQAVRDFAESLTTDCCQEYKDACDAVFACGKPCGKALEDEG